MTICTNNVLRKMINDDITSIITEKKLETRKLEGIEEDVQKARTKLEFGEEKSVVICNTENENKGAYEDNQATERCGIYSRNCYGVWECVQSGGMFAERHRMEVEKKTEREGAENTFYTSGDLHCRETLALPE